MTRRLRIEWRPGEKVPGLLEMPARPESMGVLLAHGAGAGQDSPFMRRVRRGLAGHGFPVLSFDYPYVAAGRRRPDRQETLLACHAAAAHRLRTYVDAFVLAGKSMGGRMASHLAAGEEKGSPLVVFGYPIVPIGKTEPRDTGHLESVDSALFFCGTRDRMCPLDLLTDIVTRMPMAEIAVIEDGDHSLSVPKRSGRSSEEILDGVIAITADWIRNGS